MLSSIGSNRSVAETPQGINLSKPPSTILGKQKGTTLKSAPVKREYKVFVSRLVPSVTVDQIAEFIIELTGESPVIEKLTTKYNT